MATYDELREALRNLSGLYGADSWRRLLSTQDVRAVDGYLRASEATDRFEQSPTGQWVPSTEPSGQVGYVDTTTGTFYPALSESTGDSPQVPDTLVGVVRNIYDDALRGGPLTDEQPLRTDEQQRGDAAEAIKALERAMVRQQSEVADADLSLAEAVMRAHSTAEAGTQQLDALQKKIDDYIRAHPGLDTPAGAREFQRFLIGVMDEIKETVTTGSLDAASVQGILEPLWQVYQLPEESLEEAPAAPAPGPTEGTQSEPSEGQQNSPAPAQQAPAAQTEPPTEPSIDDLMGTEPALFGDLGPAAQTGQSVQPSAMPSLGGMGLPTGATGSTPASGTSTGLPTLPNLFGSTDSQPGDLTDLLTGDELLPDDTPEEEISADEEADQEESDPEEEDANPETVVHLPNGDTVTAPNPQIAAAITAAATGTPVAEAYRLNGMTISPVGTPVEEPVDEADLTAGDIGLFSDHHVIALGDSKALVNTAVQPVADARGPGFLGWEHPPAARLTSPSDAGAAPTNSPAPTRVATTS